jgi:hypothetical protein
MHESEVVGQPQRKQRWGEQINTTIKKMILKRWQILAGVVLFVAATAASALSLGRVRGTALIGRGLDLSVQGNLEPQEAVPEAGCFSVDVFYGETRVSPSSVSVSPERTSTGELNVRVRSSTIVDEPVVTVFLRASCSAAVSRRYVLLAETLSDAEAGSAQPSIATPRPSAPSILPRSPRIAFGGATAESAAATAPANESTSEARAARAKRDSQRQARRDAREQRVAGDAATPSRAPSRGAAPIAGLDRSGTGTSVVRKAAKVSAPKLELDLLDFAAANVSLRGSTELSSVPSTDEAVRSQALALWRSLNASPEEAMRDSLRLATLETQLRSAQEQSKRQVQEISKLSVDVESARAERYVNPLTIGLGLLSLVALGLCAWLWRRSSVTGQPWWGSSASSKSAPQDERHLWTHLADGGESASAPLGADTYGLKPAGAGVKPIEPALAGIGSKVYPSAAAGSKVMPTQSRFSDKPIIPAGGVAATKIETSGLAPSLIEAAPQERVDSSPPPMLVEPSSTGRSGRSGFGNSEFAASTFGTSRVVDAEELFDIQEQADFFMSLGQTDQAIEVLKNHITENVETSALAYMDLFDIYHRANRERDYSELREEFNHVFNAQVPEFSRYGAPSNGLEGAPDVLGAIQEVWDRPSQAQDVIEESIFRKPGQDQHPLDMLAYRELMLLYALAKELGRPGAKFSLLPTSMQSAVLPSISGGLGGTDVDLGDGLVISGPDDDMLSLDGTGIELQGGMSRPQASSSLTTNAGVDDGIDFDLSESELSDLSYLGKNKKL